MQRYKTKSNIQMFFGKNKKKVHENDSKVRTVSPANCRLQKEFPEQLFD
jgi:hypothetical protein